MKKFLRALAGPFVELIKSESGEFMTTREKSRLLDAMMREQRETSRAKAVVKPTSNEPPLTARHIQSA
jgi:hypothetical protein